MNSFRGMFGGHNQGQSAFDSGGSSRRAVGLAMPAAAVLPATPA